MNNTNDILDELKSMGSHLGDLPRNMPFAVPVGYFENFNTSTQQLIKDVGDPGAAPAFGKAMPYSVPAGYFESLPGSILAKVNSRNVFPDLTAAVPFSVPQGYFDSLPERALAMAKASEPKVKKVAKTIPLNTVYAVRSIRWAAAAILVIFIGFGGLFFLRQSASESEIILATVPRNDIQDYLQHTYRIDVNNVVNSDISNLQVDNKAIIEYLNETGWDAVD